MILFIYKKYMLDLGDDSMYEILSFCDIFSLEKLLLVNKILNIQINEYLDKKYSLLIDKMKTKQEKFSIRNEDIFKLLKQRTNPEFEILLMLLIKYNYNYFNSYSTWYDNEKFSIENHPPCKNFDYRIPIYRNRLWYNSDRLNLYNKNLNLTYKNLLNRYEGMGYDYSLFHITNTDKYFLDYQGGSNGFDYDSAIERISNKRPEELDTMTLLDAIEKLIP